MVYLVKYWYIALIAIFYIYSAIKNAQKVNQNRPGIPSNQPDMKPEAKRKAEKERRDVTALPVRGAAAARTAPQPPPLPPAKSFEETMGEMFGQYADKRGEGYGDAKPFSYDAPASKPMAEASKSYNFGDNLVGDIKDRKVKTTALRGEIGSEDENPETEVLEFDPRTAVMYSILLERKYFEV